MGSNLPAVDLRLRGDGCGPADISHRTVILQHIPVGRDEVHQRPVVIKQETRRHNVRTIRQRHLDGERVDLLPGEARIGQAARSEDAEIVQLGLGHSVE